MILPMLVTRIVRHVLFLAPSALIIQTTFLLGETFPGLSHCVQLGGAA